MNGTRFGVRTLAPAALAICLVLPACRRNPGVAYARQLERAASWASAVVFTTELEQQRRVPARFADDVMSTAAKELRAIQSDIAARDQVNPSSRQQAADWCARLDGLIEQGLRSRSPSSAGEIRDLEQRLRTAARAARSAEAAESRR